MSPKKKKKRQPQESRYIVTVKDTAQIRKIQAEITLEEAKYSDIISQQLGVSTMSKEFDELVSKANECSIRIDSLKQKIQNLYKTGKQHGQPLDKGYEMFVSVKFGY